MKWSELRLAHMEEHGEPITDEIPDKRGRVRWYLFQTPKQSYQVCFDLEHGKVRSVTTSRGRLVYKAKPAAETFQP